MPDAAQKVARAWLEAALEKRADSGPRYNLFDSVPDADQRGKHRGIFDSPGREPAARPEPPRPGRGIFDSPGAARAPAPAPRAEPPAPAAPPEAPQAPQAPPQPPAAPPQAPAAPAAPEPARAQPGAQPGAPNLKGLKRDKKFKKFLQEKHQGGEGKVPHPKPQLRRRYRDGIKFWTAMKHQEFHGGIMREFEAWKQEDAGGEGAAGRQVGQRVGDGRNLRKGDVVQLPEGQKWRVMGHDPARQAYPFQMQKLDSRGKPVGRRMPAAVRPGGWLPDAKIVELADEPAAGRDAPAELDPSRGKRGERVQSLERMRVGDLVQRHDGGPRWRVVGLNPDTEGAWPLKMERINAEGVAQGRPLRHNPEHMLPNYEFFDLAREDRPNPPQVSRAPGPREAPADEGWREADAKLQKLAREGTPVGHDVSLGDDNTNGAVKRRMKLADGTEHDFVFKSRELEQPHARIGTPELAPREEAVYAVDSLLGDGRIVPATATVPGDDPHTGGAYQAFVPGARTLYSDIGPDTNLLRLKSKDLAAHPGIQRMSVLDALMGHEDRHGGNVMFSWKDPDGPKTTDNLEVHAIDNGYSLAESYDKQGDSGEILFDIRDPWIITTNWQDPDRIEDRWGVQKQIFKRLPEKLHEQLKKVDPAELAKTLVKSGLKDESAIQATLVRLAVMQDNPEIIGSLAARRRNDPVQLMGPHAWSATQKGQHDFQRMSHTKAAKLLNDHTDLEDGALENIQRIVREALEG